MTLPTPRRIQIGDAKIKLLLYGKAGAGKTTLAATAADHELLAPVLFINFEAGLISIAERGDIDSVELSSIDEVDELIEAIRTRRKGYDHYKTVVIDSGSELYQRSLDEAVAGTVSRDLARGKQGRTIDTTTLEDYGTASRQTYRLFRALRDLPVNVIVTAHAKFDYLQGADTRSADPIGVGPLFSGSLSTKLIGIFDFVWYLYEEEGERNMLTNPYGVYIAKTRGHSFAESLGGLVTEPNLPDLYSLLLSSFQPGVRPEHHSMVTKKLEEVGTASDASEPLAPQGDPTENAEEVSEEVPTSEVEPAAEESATPEPEEEAKPKIRQLRDRDGNPIARRA